jgi:hypothetical protein
MDASSVDRILGAVGLERVPAGLDKGELLSDLEGAAALYRTGAERRRALRGLNAQKAAKIVAAAERLKSLLGSDPRLRHHRKALDRLISDVNTDLSPKLKSVLGLHNKVSAFEQLIGFMLRSTFENHFGGTAGYTKAPDSNAVTGAFIDFAEASLKELKIDVYNRRSIADAFTKVRRS